MRAPAIGLLTLAAVAGSWVLIADHVPEQCLPGYPCYLPQHPRIESYTEYPEDGFGVAKVGFTLTNVGGDDRPVECVIFIEDTVERLMDAEVIEPSFWGSRRFSHLVGVPLRLGRPERARIECENPENIE